MTCFDYRSKGCGVIGVAIMQEIATISKGLLLQHSVIKHRVSQRLLQLAVLVLQGLQELGIRYLEAAVLGLPFEERGAADPLLAADVGRLGSGLLLAQDPDDPLFREPARLHVHPFPGDGLYPFLEDFAELIIRSQRVERGQDSMLDLRQMRLFVPSVLMLAELKDRSE